MNKEIWIVEVGRINEYAQTEPPKFEVHSTSSEVYCNIEKAISFIEGRSGNVRRYDGLNLVWRSSDMMAYRIKGAVLIE